MAELIREWDDLVPAPGYTREAVKAIFQQRDGLIKRMSDEHVYPQEIETRIEKQSGLYPAIDDPLFIQKLMSKREFAESKQASIEKQATSGANPCGAEQDFELTPVQRFVSRLLNPSTPYRSARLFSIVRTF